MFKFFGESLGVMDVLEKYVQSYKAGHCQITVGF
jgi:hypothetical protein